MLHRRAAVLVVEGVDVGHGVEPTSRPAKSAPATGTAERRRPRHRCRVGAIAAHLRSGSSASRSRSRPGFLLGLLAPRRAQQPGSSVRRCGSSSPSAIFTLVHELGHALAARRFGAESAISLSFLVGWASFRPTPAARRSSSGSPSRPPGRSCRSSSARSCSSRSGTSRGRTPTCAPTPVRWPCGGPVRCSGCVNLLPLEPMDGGNIVATRLDAVIPGAAAGSSQWWTLVVTVVADRGRRAVADVATVGRHRRPVRRLDVRSFTAGRPPRRGAEQAARRGPGASPRRPSARRGPRAGPGSSRRRTRRRRGAAATCCTTAGHDARRADCCSRRSSTAAGRGCRRRRARASSSCRSSSCCPTQPPVGDLHAGVVLQKALLDTGLAAPLGRRTAPGSTRRPRRHRRVAAAASPRPLGPARLRPTRRRLAATAVRADPRERSDASDAGELAVAHDFADRLESRGPTSERSAALSRRARRRARSIGHPHLLDRVAVADR